MAQEKNNTRILADMRTALAVARKLNNKKAISEEILIGNPKTSDNARKIFLAWTKAIDDIYAKVTPWALKFNDKSATDEELQQIYADVMPMWAALKGDEKIFIRSNDVHRILGFALKVGKTTKGSVDVATGKTEFRKSIETMLGIRLSQSEVLTEDEFKTISRYDKAVSNLDKAEARLKGYTGTDGKYEPGLEEQLKDAKGKLEEIQALIAGHKDLLESPIIAGYEKTVADLESKVKQTKASIKKYKDTIADLKDDYKTAMDKIATIPE